MPINPSNTVVAGQPQQKPQQRKGSGFVNLSRILGANANNRLAQTVGAGISGGAAGVRQGLGQAQQQFQQESQLKNLGSEANVAARQAALNRISQGDVGIEQPTIEQFGQFRAGQYAGPKELDQTKLSQIGAKARETESFGKSLQGGGDKSQVLRSFVGKTPDYSQGEQKLDALLLGKGPQAALQQARQQSQGLQQQIGRGQETARETGKLREGQAAQFGAETRRMLGLNDQGGFDLEGGQGAVPELYKQLQSRLLDYQAQQPGQLQGLQSRIQSHQLTPEEKLLFNPITESNTPLYGVDPRQFIGAAQPLDISTVSSPQERARMEALAKLSGTPQELLNTQASQYNAAQPFNIDQAGFQQAVQDGLERYQGALNQPRFDASGYAKLPSGKEIQTFVPGSLAQNLQEAARQEATINEIERVGGPSSHTRDVRQRINDMRQYAQEIQNQYGANQYL